ncbi:ATP-grasp domain-containing protein [Comamonadaceae bacterium OH3737_COT-264]|nr:ATP-grasp domain-containing protein [Comamonadaceae bacterium OH3737_COT-264]
MLGILSAHYENMDPHGMLHYEDRELKRWGEEIFGECNLIDPGKIYIKISKKEAKIHYVDDDRLFERLKVILFRRTRGMEHMMRDLVIALERLYPHILILDSVASVADTTSKISSLLTRREKGIPQLDTTVMLSPSVWSSVEVGMPAIVKPSHGHNGIGVEMCNTRDELGQCMARMQLAIQDPATHMGYGVLAQDYIQVDHEYRVVVINGHPLACAEKFGDKLVRNAAQGAIFLEKNNLDAMRLAADCAIKQELFFVGVDIIVKDNNFYVLECNRSPMFGTFDKATGLHTAQLLMREIHRQLDPSAYQGTTLLDDLVSNASKFDIQPDIETLQMNRNDNVQLVAQMEKNIEAIDVEGKQAVSQELERIKKYLERPEGNDYPKRIKESIAIVNQFVIMFNNLSGDFGDKLGKVWVKLIENIFG